jgi:hypothetical protein
MNRTTATATRFACAAPFAITISLIGSVCLAGGSGLFATLAAMQIALIAGATAGRLAGNRRLAFAR